MTVTDEFNRLKHHCRVIRLNTTRPEALGFRFAMDQAKKQKRLSKHVFAVNLEDVSGCFWNLGERLVPSAPPLKSTADTVRVVFKKQIRSFVVLFVSLRNLGFELIDHENAKRHSVM